MKKHFRTLFETTILTALLMLPFFVFAQSGNPAFTEGTGASEGAAEVTTAKPLDKLTTVATGGGYGEADLPNVLALVVKSVLGLLGVVFIIMIIVAGYIWLSAGGDEGEVEKAQKYIKRAIIGLVITISAWAIWGFVSNSLIG